MNSYIELPGRPLANAIQEWLQTVAGGDYAAGMLAQVGFSIAMQLLTRHPEYAQHLAAALTEEVFAAHTETVREKATEPLDELLVILPEERLP